MIVLIGFTGLHIRFLFTNYTTLEYCEKRRGQGSTWQTSPYYLPDVRYNLSLKLGFDNPLWWFIPVEHTKHPDRGFAFENTKLVTT